MKLKYEKGDIVGLYNNSTKQIFEYLLITGLDYKYYHCYSLTNGHDSKETFYVLEKGYWSEKVA
jgi:hypothetical protein